MRQLFLVATTLVALSLPLAAQRGGSANRSAPKVGQSIEFAGGASVELKYRSLTWAGGQFMERLKTDAGREQTNADLKANPTGTLTCSTDVTLGGTAVKAGTYKLYFEVDAQQSFHLVLANEAGAETKWKLTLAEGNDMNTRLTLTLTAGKSDKEANVGIAFGKMSCTVGLSTAAAGNAAPAKKQEAAAPAAGHGK